MSDEKELLRECYHTLAALQWAGSDGATGCITCGHEGNNPICPLCYGDIAYGHNPGCKIWDLIRRTKATVEDSNADS